MNPFHAELTPIGFLDRSNRIFGAEIAVEDLDSGNKYSYSEFTQRVKSLSSVIKGLRTRKGGKIAFLSLNSSELLEAHFGIPLARTTGASSDKLSTE